MKTSIIITSFKEKKTIGRAIEAFLAQEDEFNELIVSAPDDETLSEAKTYKKISKKLRIIKDEGKGKPAALNKVFKIAKGDILILSDGDVFVSKDAVRKLKNKFKDGTIGGVSGRVISTNNNEDMMGFWAHILTSAFDKKRERENRQQRDIVCSGYLYAIRKGIVEWLPEETLADDAYISLMINKKGFKTIYEREAEVYVKYPENINDWIKQKRRTAGRIYQLEKEFGKIKGGEFESEIFAALSV